jgi:membrane associated rhomboid family serine protease
VLPIRDDLPTRTVPFVNYLLIAGNVAAYLWEQTVIAHGVRPQRLLEVYGLVPHHLVVDPAGTLVTVFTSMFMHDPSNLLHIGGNMLFLWIFGDNVEDAMGHFRYLFFYLVGGMCAAATQTLADPTSVLPMVGASGAISAVLAAYCFLYPRSPIKVLNPIVAVFLPVAVMQLRAWSVLGPAGILVIVVSMVSGFFWHFPAWLVIAEFFLVNLWSALTMSAQGGVAFLAHVGGFVGGALLLRTFMFGRVSVDDYARWQQWKQRRPPRPRDSW